MRAVLQVFTFDVAAKAMLAAATILLIRFTPQQEYALYTFALSLSTLVSQTVSSTFNRIYIVGHDEIMAQHDASTFFWLQMWSVAAITVVFVPLAASMGALYFLAAALAAASCLSEHCKTALQQEQRFLAYSMAELGRAGAMAVSVLLLIAFYGHGVRAHGIFAVQTIAVSVVFGALFRRQIDLQTAHRVGSAARLAVTIARGGYRWLLGYFIVLAVFVQTDVLMLKALGTDVELASYGAAFRYYSLLSLALAAVHGVLLPKIRQLRSAQELTEVTAQHGRLALLFVPAVALFAWAAQWLLPWIDLGKYPASVDVLRILCVSAVLSFAFSPHVNVIMRYERFLFLFRLVLVGLAANLILNWVLIPIAGAQGAAWATLLASAGVTVPIYLLSRRLIAALEPAR